jgi:hypothetical protein
MEAINIAILVTAVYVGMVAYILYLHHKLKILAWGGLHLTQTIKRIADGEVSVARNAAGTIEIKVND